MLSGQAAADRTLGLKPIREGDDQDAVPGDQAPTLQAYLRMDVDRRKIED
jgi:hypothetical protein